MKTKKWKIPFEGIEIPSEFTDAGFPPLLAAVLALREISSLSAAKQLCENEKVLFDPLAMTDMDKAVDRIRAAVASCEKIAVYGDYDVDGITASCLLKKYFQSKGLDCIVHIPDRENEGYGLNSEALDRFLEQGVNLVITVDCGITAVDEARHAKDIGLDLIITDHHECPQGPLPDALAVIDCKRPDDHYDFENLAGVGVAFKLACAVEGNPDLVLEQYSDLIAVGTVSDVMPLVSENHYIVKKGLEKLNSSPCVGLKAMLDEISPDKKAITAGTIGYSIAPRLNAAGRLGEVSVAEELVSCEDPARAEMLAAHLAKLNKKRQEIGDKIWQDALSRLYDNPSPNDPIVLFDEEWDPGVIGIAASRLADKYSLPAIMIHIRDGVGKGSCRSSSGFNMFDALSACSDHLLSFGGHAPAAGLKVMREKIEDFRRAFSEYYLHHKPEPVPDVNCELLITDPALLSVENVSSLEMLEPYGNENPKPLMAMYGVTVTSISAVGASRQHAKMTVLLGGSRFDCIFFSHTPEELQIYDGCKADIAFHPQINDFNGNVQLNLSSLKIHDGSELCSALLGSSPDLCMGFASGFTPDRQNFIEAWRTVSRSGFRVGCDVDAMIAQAPSGMAPEQFCICLIAFYQAGLLKNPCQDGIFGSESFHPGEKVELDCTDIIKKLKSI